MSIDDTMSQPMNIDAEEGEQTVINPENVCCCCSKHCLGDQLGQQLDTILDPALIFSSTTQPDRIWTVLAHGHADAAAYIDRLNEFRLERFCFHSWSPGYVAYRCRTCSQAPSMAICAECFKPDNHVGHDYNMFKSRSGGACDCGYAIMKSSGHCSSHGQNAGAPRSDEPIPDQLTCLPRRAMPRMLSRLVIQLRRQVIGQTNENDIYLYCLIKIANSSTVLRSIMIQVITSEEAYSSQHRLLSGHRDPGVSKIFQESQKILKKERKKLASIKLPSTWTTTLPPINPFMSKRPPKTFLEELVFWMVVYDFNQTLVSFLLCFLMDNDYKETFSRLFINYYPNIALRLTDSLRETQGHQQDSLESLSRRILRVSAQLYNDITIKICDEELALHTLIYCIRVMIEGSQIDGIQGAISQNSLCQQNSQAPMVVCCDSQIFLDRQLVSLMRDLQNIFKFEHEAKRLLDDKNLLHIWMEMLIYFQTMQPYKRELFEHAPYETGARLSTFMIESEFCLVPLWTILNHLKSGGESVHYTKNLLDSIQRNLCVWFNKMSIRPNSKLDAYNISFHIPMHRMLAATIRHMIYEQEIPEKFIYVLLSKNLMRFCPQLGVDDFIKMLLLHPFQSLSLYHQIRCGMWTRNGLTTVNQAITYNRYAHCYLIIDMDMFLLRYCASRLRPDSFLRSLLQKFSSWRCLSFTCGPIFTSASQDTLRAHYYFNIQSEQISQMFESSLLTLIQLLTLNNHCYLKEREQMKQEMISLISVADRPYSYLIDMLPSINKQMRNEEMFASILEEVAIYKPALHGAGGSLQQGSYTLKSKTWQEDYDPVHILYRFYQRRDYQQSLERYFDHARQIGKLSRRHHSGLWPPLKVPTTDMANFGPLDLSPLLGSPTLSGIIFSTIFKCVYVEEIPDQTMAYVIYLLELALRKSMKQDLKKPARSSSFAGKFTYRELISYCENLPLKETFLRGRTIYSVVCPVQEAVAHSDIRYFPFVKHALDLAFDTWFPFESIVHNCLVHIETVHSLPRDEFEMMIQAPPHIREGGEDESTIHQDESHHSSDLTPEGNRPDTSATSSTRSTESQTAVWSNLIGFEVDELVDSDHDMETLENIEDDEIDVDEEEQEDEEELLDYVSLANDTAERDNLTDGDQTDRDYSVSIESNAGETLDPASRWEVTTRPLEAVDSANNLTTSSEPLVSESNEHDANPRWTPRAGRIEPSMPHNINATTITSNSNQDETPSRVGRPDVGSASSGSSAAMIHHERIVQAAHDQSTPSSVLVGTRDTTIVRWRTETIPNERLQQIFQLQQQPVQAQNLITERRAILNSPPRPMITNQAQPLVALEGPGGGDDGESGAASVPAAASTTRDASTNQGSQEQFQAQQHLGELAPSNRPPSLSSLPVDPQDFLELVNQMEQRRHQLQQQQLSLQQLATGGNGASNQMERSLSEVDIQARFMGFFQSDAVSRANSLGIIRPRREPRRFIRYSVVGGGALNNRDALRTTAATEPYLAYTNQNNNNNNNLAGVEVGTITTNNNNNNNDNESIQELVRRSAAVVPTIVDAIRATRSQFVAAADEFAVAAAGHLHHQQHHNHHNYAEQQRLERFLPTDQRSRRLRKEHRQHHGESILTLLLRLHAKYSQRPRSYKFDPERAQASLNSGCRLGDGAHFVSIALDLICCASESARMRVEHLTDLIWPKPCGGPPNVGATCGSGIAPGAAPAAGRNEKSLTSWTSAKQESVDMEKDLTPRTSWQQQAPKPRAPRSLEERRLVARERQNKLMAEFASKQRAFMEKYEAGNGPKSRDVSAGLMASASSQVAADKTRDAADRTLDEQPINLSSKSSDHEAASQSQQLALTPAAQNDNNGPSWRGQRQEAGASRNQSHAAFEADGRKRLPLHECCICGVEGAIDLTNPLGQVVLLQSSSVCGHSHLRPKHERRLPCDESEHLTYKEETYAKYLERRIDVLSNNFSESSWLDSINIGAEGGVHVQSCGHHLHIECHQSYIRSLDREEGLRPRQDSDEFQCPVCRQLANSVLPVLTERFFLPRDETSHTAHSEKRPSTSSIFPVKHNESLGGQAGGGGQSHQDASLESSQASEITPSEMLDHQIAQVALQLRIRRAPDHRELQSSATFCRHLTKATGPQYRLVRTDASMHSLFLFLSSIARTNLEIGLIARSTKRTTEAAYVQSAPAAAVRQVASKMDGKEAEGPGADGGDNSRGGYSRRAGFQPAAGSSSSMRLTSDKRTCFQSLFHVLALNAQTVINDQWFNYDHVWTHLTHSTSGLDKVSVRQAAGVPLLLRDPIAMLLQLLFAVSDSKSHEASHFACLVKILFNLTVIQSAALVLSYADESKSIPIDILARAAKSKAKAATEGNCGIGGLPDTDGTSAECQQLAGSTSLRQFGQKDDTDEVAGIGPHGSDKRYDDEKAFESQNSSSKGNKKQPTELTGTRQSPNGDQSGVEGLLVLVWENLSCLLTRTNVEPLMNPVVRNCWQLSAGQRERDTRPEDDDGREAGARGRLRLIENKIKLACLPFLRAAAFLQEHLYAKPCPSLFWESDQDCLALERVESDFSRLVECLELGGAAHKLLATGGAARKQQAGECETLAPISLQQTLNWPTLSRPGGSQSELIASWALELHNFARDFSIAARSLLLCRPLVWFRPALMQLPHSFDDIFMFYYRRKCSLCQQVPKDVAVCLVCGAPICFRVSCCKDRSRSRQVHSQHCGANTAVFLAVHTSSVVVIRGGRACVWGSVYLDAHDEEDNGLQRGKPLHLVPARYALLEAQWLSHSFDHTCGKRWIYLQEAQ